MIHHLSISAENPLHVASVLAEVWYAKVFKFPYPDSYGVFPFDTYGTGIEVFPLECVMLRDFRCQVFPRIPGLSD